MFIVTGSDESSNDSSTSTDTAIVREGSLGPNDMTCNLFQLQHFLYSLTFYLDARTLAKLQQINRTARSAVSVAFSQSKWREDRQEQLPNIHLESLYSLEHLFIAEYANSMETEFYFDWMSSDAEESNEELDLIQLGQLAGRHPCIHLHLEGHCAVQAPDAVAPGFSRQRARGVARVLHRGGARPSQMTLIGKGKSEIIARTDGQNSYKNRRVEVKIFLPHPSAEVVTASETSVEDEQLNHNPTGCESFARGGVRYFALRKKDTSVVKHNCSHAHIDEVELVGDGPQLDVDDDSMSGHGMMVGGMFLTHGGNMLEFLQALGMNHSLLQQSDSEDDELIGSEEDESTHSSDELEMNDDDAVEEQEDEEGGSGGDESGPEHEASSVD